MTLPQFLEQLDMIWLEEPGPTGATSVAAIRVWKHSIMRRRLRVEERGQRSFAERRYSVLSDTIST